MTTDPRATLEALDRIGEQLAQSAPAQRELTIEPATPHEWLARALRNAQSQWFSLAGTKGPDDGQAA